ncbi:MAG: RNA polymerase sigma-54 factor, partial [Microvirga sp.]
MALSQRLEIRQGQSLVMTPQLLQAIKLLQLSHLDLAAYVDAELERNPLLERVEEEGPPETLGPAHEDSPSAEPSEGDGGDAGEGDAPADNWLTEDRGASRAELEGEHDTGFENVFQDEVPDRAPPTGGDAVTLTASPWSNAGGGGFDGEAPDFEATLASEASLHDHLAAQLDLATVDPAERLIGRHLVDAVNEAGYLTETVDDIADRLGAEPTTVERVLRLVQGFEPSGIAARDLAECLTIQLREQNRFDPAMAALVGRLDLVAKRDFPALKRLCGVDDEDLAEMLAEIRALDPKPGRAFAGSPVQILVPDVFVRPAPDGSWIVELNSGTLPRVLMNQSYYAKVSRTLSKDADKAFITECLQTAN